MAQTVEEAKNVRIVRHPNFWINIPDNLPFLLIF